MKRALAFAGAITSALLYTLVTLCMIPFTAGIWALACAVRGLEWLRERVA